MSSENEKGLAEFFCEQLAIAQQGVGSDFMPAGTAVAFAEFALGTKLGVSKVEAYGVGASRGKHRLDHQTLGLDVEGENWKDHRDPASAFALFRQKVSKAQGDGLELRYKVWLDRVAGN